MNRMKKLVKIHPALIILTSFMMAILTGSLLLLLPLSTVNGGITPIDAFFTATSAVCVTGLVVVDTGTFFSTFGQWVILVLIQIGGLGVMTISVALFQLLGKDISFKQRLTMQDLFSHTPREDITAITRSIIYFTLGSEVIGTLLLFISWQNEMPMGDALYASVFHSVSAFCNAGFSLFPDSIMSYSHRSLINVVLCSLIVIGGIGFPVLYDLQILFSQRKQRRVKLSVQSKTVLATTLALIFVGTLLFAALEHDGQLKGVALPEQVLISLFQSITCRTAGFNTVDIASLQDSTLLVMIVMMFIGASPGSCGGGVKTTTFALISTFTLQRISGRRRVSMFKKSIPTETAARSITLVLVSLGTVTVVFFLVLAGGAKIFEAGKDNHGAFLSLLFETVSAFGTVGLSMGATSHLNIWGKFWIIFMMLLGRVGILTFAYSIIGIRGVQGVDYSEQNIMIG